MPRLSVCLVRASLIYLLVGFTLGGLMLANKGILISPMIWSFLPLHMEFAFVGWMIQLAMGIAFWILPRFNKGAPRGNERLVWLAFVLVNLGIFFVTLDYFFGLPWLTFAGRATEVFGLLSFIIGHWRRIKPFDT